MPEKKLTLNDVKAQAKVKTFRASDFLSKDEQEAVKVSNQKSKKRRYSVVDAWIAEVIARFGYDAYLQWKSGNITLEQMNRYVEAERDRDLSARVELEGFILASVAGANHPTKSGHAPKTLKTAFKVLKKKEQSIGRAA